jgi:hypothetical protein
MIQAGAAAFRNVWRSAGDKVPLFAVFQLREVVMIRAVGYNYRP